jgi:hypothetical protein
LTGYRGESDAVVHAVIDGRSFAVIHGLGGVDGEATYLHTRIIETYESRLTVPATLDLEQTGHDDATPDGAYVLFLGAWVAPPPRTDVHWAMVDGGEGALRINGSQVVPLCHRGGAEPPARNLADVLAELRSTPQPPSARPAP